MSHHFKIKFLPSYILFILAANIISLSSLKAEYQGQHPDILLAKAQIELAQNNLKNAQRYLTSIVAISKYNDQAILLLAQIFIRKNQYKKAIKLLQKKLLERVKDPERSKRRNNSYNKNHKHCNQSLKTYNNPFGRRCLKHIVNRCFRPSFI